jgi:hypothetical protein
VGASPGGREWVGAEGGCACGALRYRLSAAPASGYLCHCHQCQKRSGSAFSFQLVFAQGALAFVSGEPLIRGRATASGGVMHSAWCPHCASRISIDGTDWPWITLRAGTLDETTHLRPVAQIWTASAQAWAVVPDILSFEGQPEPFASIIDAGRAVYG